MVDVGTTVGVSVVAGVGVLVGLGLGVLVGFTVGVGVFVFFFFGVLVAVAFSVVGVFVADGSASEVVRRIASTSVTMSSYRSGRSVPSPGLPVPGFGVGVAVGSISSNVTTVPHS